MQPLVRRVVADTQLRARQRGQRIHRFLVGGAHVSSREQPQRLALLGKRLECGQQQPQPAPFHEAHDEVNPVGRRNFLLQLGLHRQLRIAPAEQVALRKPQRRLYAIEVLAQIVLRGQWQLQPRQHRPQQLPFRGQVAARRQHIRLFLQVGNYPIGQRQLLAHLFVLRQLPQYAAQQLRQVPRNKHRRIVRPQLLFRNGINPRFQRSKLAPQLVRDEGFVVASFQLVACLDS